MGATSVKNWATDVKSWVTKQGSGSNLRHLLRQIRASLSVALPGWEAAMPGAIGTWHGTSPATGYRSSLLVVVVRFLPQHFLFGTLSIA
jgi:hypothetical protein